MKLERRFYVAHPKVTTPGDTWAKRTLAAAIAHGREMLEKDPTRDFVAIVEIVRVVRRPKPPMVIEVAEQAPARKRAARKAKAPAKAATGFLAVSCPVCRARVGQMCRSGYTGRLRIAHTARKTKAAKARKATARAMAGDF